MSFSEPLEGLTRNASVVILDFDQIPPDLLPDENIQRFFEDSLATGIDSRLPKNRQKFNDRLIALRGVRYLIGPYKDDRSAMLVGSEIYVQGRVLPLGVDIFATDLEPVY